MHDVLLWCSKWDGIARSTTHFFLHAAEAKSELWMVVLLRSRFDFFLLPPRFCSPRILITTHQVSHLASVMSAVQDFERWCTNRHSSHWHQYLCLISCWEVQSLNVCSSKLSCSSHVKSIMSQLHRSWKSSKPWNRFSRHEPKYFKWSYFRHRLIHAPTRPFPSFQIEVPRSITPRCWQARCRWEQSLCDANLSLTISIWTKTKTNNKNN